ncbi:hypothetical protein [Sediminicoccus sp. BL-A-41-H5]|uniref:hypothetical protein n=1 Tax=Sediminicoccus sp. BL-A-41-H5 TaxID=3421106 RepID=UPI003D665BA8
MRKILLLALLSLAPGLARAQEPAAVTQLRRMLGPDVTLTFDRATATDVAGSAVLNGAVLRRREETIRITEARLEGLREDGIARLSLRGVALEGGDLPLTLDRLDLEGVTVPRPAAGKTLMPHDVRVDLLRLEGWRSAGDVPVNIGAIAIENFGGGRTGQASLTAIEVRAGMGIADRLTIARVAYAGLDAADLLTASIEQRAPRWEAGRQSLEIEGVALNQGGEAVARLSGLTLRGEIAADRAHSGEVALRGLEVMPAPPHAEWMERLGYSTVAAEARLRGAHDVQRQLLELRELDIELRDVGELHLDFRADRVPEGMGVATAPNARLLGARLRYADLSLFRRWVATQAAQERISEAVLRRRLTEQSAALLPGPALAEARAALARFIRGEATVLELAARPRAPLAFSMVTAKPQSSLEGWRDMFGLSLTAR